MEYGLVNVVVPVVVGVSAVSSVGVSVALGGWAGVLSTVVLVVGIGVGVVVLDRAVGFVVVVAEGAGTGILEGCRACWAVCITANTINPSARMTPRPAATASPGRSCHCGVSGSDVRSSTWVTLRLISRIGKRKST
ncbi:hypothetical protein [Mycobacterium sp.]|uniref:hypothetical protein n=1 Tax=Mycobacterium sp. TaxID=1785 RepID=UPI002D714441|nr:hypothetical protein [Mycobacterium sp.]HZA10950.1 hypothetical protein [Mycobacterium sp.]